MNKKIFIMLCFILVCCSSLVMADETFNVGYNLSQLPADGFFDVNFSLAPNETAYFTEVVNDARTNLTYPSSITLNSTNSLIEFRLNYSIPFFVDYSDNQTVLEDIFNVTNSVTNDSVLISFQYTILHPPLLNSTGNESYILLTNGGQNVEVYSYSIIEFNRTHNIDVNAPNGASINVTCGDYINCPDIVNVTEGDHAIITVNIIIPEGTLSGTYPSFVTLSTGNNSGTIDFTLIVSNDDISNLIVYDVWEESCYDTPENLAECYKKQALYNSEVANALLSRLKDGDYLCDVEKEYNETIKYVEVGNIDPDLLKANKDMRDNYNTLSTDYSTLSTKYGSCMDDKARLDLTVQQETEQLSNDFILKRSQLEKDNVVQDEEMRKKYSSKINWIMGLLSFFMLIVWMGGISLEEKWVITNFPRKIIGSITLICFVSWIIFAIFV